MLAQSDWRVSGNATALACFLLALPAMVGAQTVEDLFGVTSDKKLLRIDTVSGQGNLVGSLLLTGTPVGLASMKGGHGESASLWVLTTANFLHRIDPETGRLLTTNSFPALGSAEGGFASAVFTDGFYAAQTISGTGLLLRVSVFLTNISPVGSLSPPMSGLDSDPMGNLYGISAGNEPSLYLIDKFDATTSLIGPLPAVASGAEFGGLAIKGGDQIYAAISSSAASSLYGGYINQGFAPVGSIGYPRVCGLAFCVRRPGPLSIRLQGPNVVVSWPSTNGGYLWKQDRVRSFALPAFGNVFPATNAAGFFFLSPVPPF
jgi:hypothetical protein